MSRRIPSQMNTGSRLSQSSANTKLRVLMKNRNGSRIQPDSRYDSNSKLSRQMGRLPTLPVLSNSAYQTISSDNDLLELQEQARRSDTLNCEEDLILNKEWKCEDMKEKIEDLDRRAEDLIHKKLLKLSKKTGSFSLRDKGRDELSDQLEELISSVRQVKLEAMEDRPAQRQEVKQLIDDKINLLEKLMAEKSTESAVLKKYFFAVSASNQKKKLASGRSFMKAINPSRLQTDVCSPKQHQQQQVCRESANNLSYKAPKSNEYQTYRYRSKEYSANKQPLPRSSYGRQFLQYQSQPQETPCKRLDASPFFGLKAKESGSNYSKDYTAMQADKVNYRDLDSYRDKIKDIQIFYAYKKKQKSAQELALTDKYMKQQIKSTLMTRSDAQKRRVTQTVRNNPILSTESRRAYAGVRGHSSDIKNKGLDKLKYTYKGLVYC